MLAILLRIFSRFNLCTSIVVVAFLTIIPLSGSAITGPESTSTQQVTALETVVEPLSKKERRHVLRNFKRSLKQQLREAMAAPGASSSMNGFAIAGFVCGVVGLFVAGVLLGILAVIFSAIALHRIRTGRGGSGGRGLAIAGLVIGIVAIVGAFVVII